MKTKCLNGYIAKGELVLIAPIDDFPVMYGRVREILPANSDKAMSETDMPDTDVVHVEIAIDEISSEYIKEIEAAFSDLYGCVKSIEDIGLDDVIETPDVLLCANGVTVEQRDRMSLSMEGATAVAFELMAEHAGQLEEAARGCAGILVECRDMLSDYYGALEDSLGVVRLDDEIQSIEEKMRRVIEMQSHMEMLALSL